MEQPSEDLLVNFSLGENGGLVALKTRDDIYSYINGEMEKWSFLTEGNIQAAVNYSGGNPNEDLVNLEKSLRITEERLLKQGVDPVAIFIDVANTFTAKCKDLFTLKRRIHSNSPEGELILNTEDKLVAFCMWWLTSPKGVIHRDNCMRWPLFAAAFKLNKLRDDYQPSVTEGRVMVNLRNEWREVLSREVETFSSRNSEITLLKTRTIETLENFSKFLENSKQEHANQCTSHQSKMEEIQRKFRDEMATKTAVQYWSQRGKNYEKWAANWGMASIVYALTAILTLVGYSYSTSLSEATINRVLLAGAPAMAGQQLTVMLLASTFRVFAIGLFMAWPLRILLRNYLSCRHLATDSHERSVIVETYLALLDDPQLHERQNLKEQILPYALQNIFRHTEDGIVRDDAMPTAADMLSAIKGKIG